MLEINIIHNNQTASQTIKNIISDFMFSGGQTQKTPAIGEGFVFWWS